MLEDRTQYFFEFDQPFSVNEDLQLLRILGLGDGNTAEEENINNDNGDGDGDDATAVHGQLSQDDGTSLVIGSSSPASSSSKRNNRAKTPPPPLLARGAGYPGSALHALLTAKPRASLVRSGSSSPSHASN